MQWTPEAEKAVSKVPFFVRDCIAFYKARSRNGRRFAELLSAADIEAYGQTGEFPGAGGNTP